MIYRKTLFIYLQLVAPLINAQEYDGCEVFEQVIVQTTVFEYLIAIDTFIQSPTIIDIYGGLQLTIDNAPTNLSLTSFGQSTTIGIAEGTIIPRSIINPSSRFCIYLIPDTALLPPQLPHWFRSLQDPTFI